MTPRSHRFGSLKLHEQRVACRRPAEDRHARVLLLVLVVEREDAARACRRRRDATYQPLRLVSTILVLSRLNGADRERLGFLGAVAPASAG